MWARIRAQNLGAHHTGAVGQDLGVSGNYAEEKIKPMTDFHPLIHEYIKRVLSTD